MIERVVYTAEAEEDVSEAYAWYEACAPGLGEDFLRAIEACVSLLRRHPALYPISVDEFRRASLRRFPYEVFYENTAKAIVVYAIFHCSQNPKKWRERLRQEQD